MTNKVRRHFNGILFKGYAFEKQMYLEIVAKAG